MMLMEKGILKTMKELMGRVVGNRIVTRGMTVEGLDNVM